MASSCDPHVVRSLTSLQPCVAGKTFGCETDTSIWVQSGCRAVFKCGSDSAPTRDCGLYANPLRVVCHCAANATLREQLDDAWEASMRTELASDNTSLMLESACRDAEDASGAATQGAAAASAAAPVLAMPHQCRGLWHVSARRGKTHHKLWDHGLHTSERYGDMLECHGETYVSTRAQLGDQHVATIEQGPCWATIIRRLDRARNAFVDTRVLVSPALNMGHNAALACVDDTLHVFGGQHQLLELNHAEQRWPQPGVLHTSWRPGAPSFTAPRVVFGRERLRATGCLEKRDTIASNHAGSGECQMDGKLSAVHWKGKLWLYARANMAKQGGARHVQVTRIDHATDADAVWESWRLVDFGFTPVQLTNVYYLNVQTIEGGSRLLGLMPATGLPDNEPLGGLFASHSTDGYVWARPRLLTPCKAIGARVPAHPVHYDEGAHQLYVMGPISFDDTRSGWVRERIITFANNATHSMYRIDVPLATLLGDDNTKAAEVAPVPALPPIPLTSGGASPGTSTSEWVAVPSDPLDYSCAISPTSRRLRCEAPHFARVCAPARAASSPAATMLQPAATTTTLLATTTTTLPVVPTRLDLSRVLDERNLTSGVELGVRQGFFAAAMLGRWTGVKHYMLVDIWGDVAAVGSGGAAQYHGEKSSLTYRNTLRQKIVRGACVESFAAAAASGGGQCGVSMTICRNWTHVCMDRVADASVDFVYVDALHDYKGALRDITLWWPKLRAGGVMAGHDFNDKNAFHFGDASTPGTLAQAPLRARGDEIKKFEAWTQNYDGTTEPTGKLVKGSVEDFFGCKVVVGLDGKERAPDGGEACAHRRTVGVTSSRHEVPPSWFVLK